MLEVESENRRRKNISKFRKTGETVTKLSLSKSREQAAKMFNVGTTYIQQKIDSIISRL